MNPFTEADIKQRLNDFPEWSYTGEVIEKTFQFESYLDSISFVNKLAEQAETMGHHPDILIGYCQVTVSLSTHDANGITHLDFDLAKFADQSFLI